MSEFDDPKVAALASILSDSTGLAFIPEGNVYVSGPHTIAFSDGQWCCNGNAYPNFVLMIIKEFGRWPLLKAAHSDWE